MSQDPQPFARDRNMDKPGIVGARWWHASLADQGATMARRDAIRNILIAGGVIAGFGALLAMCIKSSSDSSTPTTGATTTLDPDEYKESRNTSLEMQKTYGWNFGATADPLVFDGATTQPFDASMLPALGDGLRPARTDLAPYYQQTLFQSPYATPTSLAKLAPEEQAGWKQLADVLKPIFTPAMSAAYARGKSLASLFAAISDGGGNAADSKVALVVDLPGPESVAFAAGAATVFDPTFLFDNWPHPRGVVKSHETLSAAAYYQPLFQKEWARAQSAPKKLPMFVLDRGRITPYTDDATQFDNRYIAKLPVTASRLKALGAEHVLYVVPRAADTQTESDDLNEDFVAYSTTGADVKAIALDTFSAGSPDQASLLDAGPTKTGAPTSETLVADSGWVYYGGHRESHFAFFADYPWIKSPRKATMRPSSSPGSTYRPTPRVTPYSRGTSSSISSKPIPTSFATVPVVVAVGTGLLLGARYSRSGSWNRSTGGGWSG
jgi:hypothetical protein